VALWWCYFHRAEEIGLKAIGSASDASRIVAVGNYALIAMVAGIIAIAVGDELAIASPGAGSTASTAALVFGGPLIFLLAQAAFMRRASAGLPRSRLVACAALIALGAATIPLSLFVAVTVSSAVLVAVAAADSATPWKARPDGLLEP
jgi:low temperature requirement protein LtrA